MARAAARRRGAEACLALMTVGLLSCGSEVLTEPPAKPDPPVVTTVALDSTSLVFDALGASQVLLATVRDQSGQVMPGVTVEWSSSDTSVAVVDGSGTVTAHANGVATVTAAVGPKTATATVTVAQIVTQVAVIAGNEQVDTVGRTLPDSIVVLARDRLDQPAVGVMLPFELTSGTVSPDSALTDATGRVAAAWTLGPEAGPHALVAGLPWIASPAWFGATALADVPDTLVKWSGDNQTGIPGRLLRHGIHVAVTDSFGNSLPGHTVVFAVTAGGGMLDSNVRVTREWGAGEYSAGTAWFLGDQEGVQTVQASVDGIKGSPVVFQATGVMPRLERIEPDTLREAYVATVFGSGFLAADLGLNLDGGGVGQYGGYGGIIEVTDTTIFFEVPLFDCRPARTVALRLASGGSVLSDSLLVPLKTLAEPLNVQVGQRSFGWPGLGEGDTGLCLQFSSTSSGQEEYVIGVGMMREDPTETASWVIASEVGASPGPEPMLYTVPRPERHPVARLRSAVVQRQRQYLRSEQQLRAQEHRVLSGRRGVPFTPSVDAGRGPALSDVAAITDPPTRIRIPNLDAVNPCTEYKEIVVKQRLYGGSVLVLVDSTYVPPVDSITNNDLVGLDALLKNASLPVARAYLDPLPDLDGNLRLIVVMSLEVNKMKGGTMPAFHFAGDLMDRTQCAASDHGEIIYAQVEDPANAAGTIARSRAELLEELPPIVTHEVAHLLMKWPRTESTLLARWQEEGQAMLVQEVAGHAALGYDLYQDYGAAVALDPVNAAWYGTGLFGLAAFQGWDAAGGHVSNAPDDCTLFGDPTLSGPTPCGHEGFVGAAWSFMRYVSDRLGPIWPGGEAALQRTLHRYGVGEDGTGTFDALIPGGFAETFADWAASLALDGRLGGAESTLQLTSWNLPDIMAAIGPGADLLIPAHTFDAFSDQRHLRAGGMLYTILTAPAGHPAFALKVIYGDGAEWWTGPLAWIARRN